MNLVSLNCLIPDPESYTFFLFFFFLETESHHIGLTAQKLTIQTKLASYSTEFEFAGFCFLNVGIKACTTTS